eukprot:m.135938 g.135938  ORF g.135938 m.135938 type:complete len:140 (-) comp10316_c0_seq1:188-607(-)
MPPKKSNKQQKKNSSSTSPQASNDAHIEDVKGEEADGEVEQENAPKSDSSKADMANMGGDGDDGMSESATMAATSRSEAIKQRAREQAAKKLALANVKIEKKDVTMIVEQMLISEQRAEAVLREHEGDVKSALKAVYAA